MLSNPVEMVFVKANVKGGKLQKPVLIESCCILLHLEPKHQWVRKASHFPHGWQEGSLESAGYSSELLLIFEVLSEVRLEASLCGEHALN